MNANQIIRTERPAWQINRRHFIYSSALAAASLATGCVSNRPNLKSPNSKLDIAIIGAGGRGAANTDAVKSENLVAFCDVNGKNLDMALAQFPGRKRFTDFRKLFDQAKDFDAVVVSTCEHTHAFATMLALHHGKHVYCEKPLTHNIWEARKIREAAAKTKVTTQMGIQVHGMKNYPEVVEIIQSGAIGPVHEAHVWVGRAWGRQSEADAKKHGDIVWVMERPTEVDPVPEGLDWTLWLGPAVDRPFSRVYFPGPKWYRWWDFGNGTMSDLGSHWNDLPFWALKLQSPLTIESSGPPPHKEIAPASMTARYTYGARGDMPPVTVTWHQGTDKPEIWKQKEIPQKDSGVLFIGSKGMLLSTYFDYVLLPEKEFKDFKPPQQTIPRVTEHHVEWIEACKAGRQASANFEYAGWLTEANHLGNVAYRTGKKLEWDAKNMRAANAPEADKFIHREYRKGWKL